ncbi:MAG: hypothetical protein HPY58_06665 [Firmicutes bacterium]|nr:hypothetical protein [Bacillota bacterium]
MTKLELLISSSDKKQRGCWRRGLLCAVTLALFLLFLEGSGRAETPLPEAVGVFWQDFFGKPPRPEGRRVVRIGITYTRGEGLSLQTFEDTPVRVQVDGSTVVTRAPFPRLEEILAGAGIELGARDRAEAKLVTGEDIPEINVIRVRSRIVAEEVRLPCPVRRVQDFYLPPGKTEVRSPGRPGLLLKKIEVTTENGVEVARKEVGAEVIRKPEPRIIACGSRAGLPARRAAARGEPPEKEARRVLKMVATAYTHTGNPTATGVWPYVGGVAVDPEVIPLGSKLYVEGYGPASAVDTGGLIKGNRIDLFFNTPEECFAFGRREVTVYVLEEGS